MQNIKLFYGGPVMFVVTCFVSKLLLMLAFGAFELYVEKYFLNR